MKPLYRVAAFAVLLFTVNVSAQGRPDLTGTWVASGGGGQTLTITQDVSVLTVIEATRGLRQTFLYRLDGAETQYETGSINGENSINVSQASWVSDALVVKTTTVRESIGGKAWDWMRMYYFDSTVKELNVTTLDPTLTGSPIMSLRTMKYVKQ